MELVFLFLAFILGILHFNWWIKNFHQEYVLAFMVIHLTFSFLSLLFCPFYFYMEYLR